MHYGYMFAGTCLATTHELPLEYIVCYRAGADKSARVRFYHPPLTTERESPSPYDTHY